MGPAARRFWRHTSLSAAPMGGFGLVNVRLPVGRVPGSAAVMGSGRRFSPDTGRAASRW